MVLIATLLLLIAGTIESSATLPVLRGSSAKRNQNVGAEQRRTGNLLFQSLSSFRRGGCDPKTSTILSSWVITGSEKLSETSTCNTMLERNTKVHYKEIFTCGPDEITSVGVFCAG